MEVVLQKSCFQQYGCSLLLILLAAVPACEKKAGVVAEMGVSFEWNPPGTPVGRNPEIHLTKVPAATQRFLAELVDLDLKAYNHCGGYYP